MLGVLALGFRRLRASYIAYMAVSILVPLSTSSLMSMPRFALVLFPMFALFGAVGRAAERQQPDRGLLDAVARLVHRALRGLVLGRLSERTLVGTAARPTARRAAVRQIRHRRRVGIHRESRHLHAAPAVVPITPRPAVLRRSTRPLSLRRRLELLPQPRLDVSLDRPRRPRRHLVHDRVASWRCSSA